MNPLPVRGLCDSEKKMSSSDRGRQISFLSKTIKCGALRDLVPFVQFKERGKHSWRSVTFRKVAV